MPRETLRVSALIARERLSLLRCWRVLMMLRVGLAAAAADHNPVAAHRILFA